MSEKQGRHYEELYNRLLERGKLMHINNKKRIRIGLIFLAVFTVGMILIRYMTDSDRATFLIIWVIGMFAISIYLIGIEYIDSSIARTLEDVTEMDSGWDELIPDSENVRSRVQGGIDERRVEVQDRITERRNERHERAREMRNEVQERINVKREELKEFVNEKKSEALPEDMLAVNKDRNAPESEDEA
jgi:hypothetical protein